MSKVTSIVVAIETDTGPQTFSVDVEKQCVLVWSDAGWDVLADYYDKVKHDPAMAKEVRERKCPKAKSKDGAEALTPGSPALIALKDPECNATEWP